MYTKSHSSLQTKASHTKFTFTQIQFITKAQSNAINMHMCPLEHTPLQQMNILQHSRRYMMKQTSKQ